MAIIATTLSSSILNLSSSVGSSTASLHVEGSGSSVVAIDGTQGRLFSVSDELSGSLFSANTIAGLPVIEAFSDNKVTLGPFAKQIVVDGSGNISGSITSTGSFGKMRIGEVTTNSSAASTMVISGKDDPGANNLLELMFDNSPEDTGVVFTDINGTVKNRITIDAASASELEIASLTDIRFTTGQVTDGGSGRLLTLDGNKISGSATSTGSFGTIRTGTTVGNLSSGIVLGDGDSGIYETSDDSVVITAGNSLENFRVNATTIRARADEFKINTSDNTTYGINLDTDNSANKISLIGSGLQTIDLSKRGKFQTSTTQNTSDANFTFAGTFDQIGSFSATAQFVKLNPTVDSSNAVATSSFTTLDLAGTIDMSGQTQETIRGLYIHPSKTSVNKYIAIDADGDIVTSGNVSGSSTSTGSFGHLFIAERDNFANVQANGSIRFKRTDSNYEVARFESNGMTYTDLNISNGTHVAGIRMRGGDLRVNKWLVGTTSTFELDGDNRLQVEGLTRINGDLQVTGSISEPSTMRIKTNIETLESPLDKITKLRGVSYNLKRGNQPNIGMIAEEVDEIFPELVSKDKDGNPEAMSYSRMTAVLLEAIKELKQEVDELRQENIYMKDMNRKNK